MYMYSTYILRMHPRPGAPGYASPGPMRSDRSSTRTGRPRWDDWLKQYPAW